MDVDEEDQQQQAELERNRKAPTLVPGDKVATLPGDRLAYVMFVGQLPNMPSGYWVGVQYDEKVGKNDGTLHGKRYFTCPPGHGGFLRASKVSRLEDIESKTAAREALAAQEAFARKNKKAGSSKTLRADGKTAAFAPDVDDAAPRAATTDGESKPAFNGRRRMSLMAWDSSRDSARGGSRSPKPRVLRPPGSTHPYRVKVSGTGLTQSVVGSLAQFTIIACNGNPLTWNALAPCRTIASAQLRACALFWLAADGDKREKGGDNFTVVMRGNGSRSQSQPALVRTKLTDRSDGTYMCEYRPWMTGQYNIEIRLDDEPIRGSPFSLNVITLRPDAAQCQVRGDALHRAVARLPQKFDVLFVDASGHTAHAEDLDVFVEPWDGPADWPRPIFNDEPEPIPVVKKAEAPADGAGEADGKADGAGEAAGNPAAAKSAKSAAPPKPVVTVVPPRPQSPAEGTAGAMSSGAASDVTADGKARPAAEEAVPVEPDGGGMREASPVPQRPSTSSREHPKSPTTSARLRIMKKLDAPTRQRHLQLWMTRQAADKYLGRRASEVAFRETGYGEDNKKKKKMGEIASMPSFLHELSADKNGFAFGGVDPGTLHAHGKLIKVHHVSYSVGLAGRYRLHVGLRQQMHPLPGSPFDLYVEPGSAYAASTKLPDEKLVLTGMADEEWQKGLVLRTADILGNLCVKGGANLTMALPKRWVQDVNLEDNPVECRVVDKGDGSYELDWTSTLAGTFPLEVCVDGSHVAGSPITVTVMPAKPDVNRFVASGAGLAKAIAGVPAPMRIRVADRFDNTADLNSNTQFGLILISSQSGAAAFNKEGRKSKEPADAPKKKKEEASAAADKKPQVRASKEDVGARASKVQESQPFVGSWVNGCYEIKYVAEHAGVLDLNLWCEVGSSGEREPLPGSPFSVHVSEGDASPVGSFVKDAEASKQGSGIIAGEHVILKPQVHDQFGNSSSAPDGALTAILDTPGHVGEVLEPPKLRSGPGSYELTLEPLKAGEHAVHILLSGEEITGSPVKFYVSPAVPNSQKCYLSRPDPEPILVNQPCDITLTTHDKYGNQLDRGGVRVDAKAAGVAASTCTIEDHKNGTYTIRLTAGAPGEVKVTARIDSVEIKTLSVFFTKQSEGENDGTSQARLSEKGSAEILEDESSPATLGDMGSSAAEEVVEAAAAAAAPSVAELAAPMAKEKKGKKGSRKGEVKAEAEAPIEPEAAAASAPAAAEPVASTEVAPVVEPTGGEDATSAPTAKAKGGKGGKGGKAGKSGSKKSGRPKGDAPAAADLG